MRAVSLALALFLPVAAAAADLPALYAVSGVGFSDSLNVREKPDAKSPVVATLAPDAIDIEVTGFSRDGSWARINSAERPGWAAARFLRRQEQPPWWDPATPLNCYGTEPFWSLRITAESTQFDSPLGREDPEEIGFRTTTGVPDNITALGIGQEGGFAVIRPAECSDGMSDRVMGLAIDLFRSLDGEESGYSGCCTLNP